MTNVVWFRQDLRLSDNPALAHAAVRGAVVPVYIFDDAQTPGRRAIGGASRWWLHHSLVSLRKALGSLVLIDPATNRTVAAAMVDRVAAEA